VRREYSSLGRSGSTSTTLYAARKVKKMDVDEAGKVSGAFLRARVAIELDKPIKRGVLLRMSKPGEPEWFDAQYENLPSCVSRVDFWGMEESYLISQHRGMLMGNCHMIVIPHCECWGLENRKGSPSTSEEMNMRKCSGTRRQGISKSLYSHQKL
jgi:hypothetical protein